MQPKKPRNLGDRDVVSSSEELKRYQAMEYDVMAGALKHGGLHLPTWSRKAMGDVCMSRKLKRPVRSMRLSGTFGSAPRHGNRRVLVAAASFLGLAILSCLSVAIWSRSPENSATQPAPSIGHAPFRVTREIESQARYAARNTRTAGAQQRIERLIRAIPSRSILETDDQRLNDVLTRCLFAARRADPTPEFEAWVRPLLGHLVPAIRQRAAHCIKRLRPDWESVESLRKEIRFAERDG